jgi:hypothetical protein
MNSVPTVYLTINQTTSGWDVTRRTLPTAEKPLILEPYYPVGYAPVQTVAIQRVALEAISFRTQKEAHNHAKQLSQREAIRFLPNDRPLYGVAPSIVAIEPSILEETPAEEPRVDPTTKGFTSIVVHPSGEIVPLLKVEFGYLTGFHQKKPLTFPTESKAFQEGTKQAGLNRAHFIYPPYPLEFAPYPN